MCDDERIEECKGCGEEACICELICNDCQQWLEKCNCTGSTSMDYFCKECRETSEPSVAMEWVNGRQTTHIHCECCGSDRVMRIDDMFDAAEYSQGDER